MRTSSNHTFFFGMFVALGLMAAFTQTGKQTVRRPIPKQQSRLTSNWNHTATQNIKLNGYWVSGDGQNQGIRVLKDGNVRIVTPRNIVIQTNGSVIRLQSGQSKVVLKADGSVEIQSGGDMTLTSARNLNLTGNNVNINAQSALNVKSGMGTTMNVGAAMKVTAGTAFTLSSGAGMAVRSQRDMAFVSGGKATLNAMQEIVQNSDKSILYKTGAAFIDMRKNGDITMKGKKIDFKASADLVMKAAKILQN